MTKKTVKFAFERSTPGAHRYQEVDGDGKKVEYKDATIGTLYLRKSSVGDNASEKITVELNM